MTPHPQISYKSKRRDHFTNETQCVVNAFGKYSLFQRFLFSSFTFSFACILTSFTTFFIIPNHATNTGLHTMPQRINDTLQCNIIEYFSD